MALSTEQQQVIGWVIPWVEVNMVDCQRVARAVAVLPAALTGEVSTTLYLKADFLPVLRVGGSSLRSHSQPSQSLRLEMLCVALATQHASGLAAGGV